MSYRNFRRKKKEPPIPWWLALIAALMGPGLWFVSVMYQATHRVNP